MNRFITQRICGITVAVFAAGIAFGVPAYADPSSGNTTTIEMPMPGPDQSADGGASYRPPTVSMSAQGGAGGVDHDGTSGSIDSDGINGRVTGPLMHATPDIRAEPAPLSPHVRS